MLTPPVLHTPATRAIVDAVHAAGGTAYFVGGCVRDRLLGIEPKDRDLLVTGLSVDKLLEILPGKVDAVGKSFGVLKVTLEGETIDVALPRTERSTGTGHRDFVVVTDPGLTVEDDLARRDFTMNAMAVHAGTDVLIDPFNGLEDLLRYRRVRAVGVDLERFREDPLRMLRAVRFVARMRLDIATSTAWAIKDSAPLLASVAKERVFDEVSKLLATDGATPALKEMVNLGMMRYIIPEWMELVDFEQHNQHHDRTVDRHVLDALDYAISRGASLRCRWAVLLHDIAKPQTFTVDEHGHGHFYQHEDRGAVKAAFILERLKAPTDLIRSVSKIVSEHLRPPADASDRVLRRFTADLGELTEDALLCRESDLHAHANAGARVDEVRSYRERLKAFTQVSGFTEAKLALRGDEIAKTFGVSGPRIGRLKKLATAAVVEGLVPNEPVELAAYLSKHLEEA
jgi:tRNA nucleotidyltransferase (CCA-adding enzyme)